MKIFSLMDAKKAKEATDLFCNLQMSDAWNSLDDDASFTSPKPGHPRRLSSPTLMEDGPGSDGTSSVTASPRKKKRLGRNTPKLRGGAWCEEDETLLLNAVRAVPETTSKRWVHVLGNIESKLKNPNRTPENLKDKYRNILKFKSHLLGTHFLDPTQIVLVYIRMCVSVFKFSWSCVHVECTSCVCTPIFLNTSPTKNGRAQGPSKSNAWRENSTMGTGCVCVRNVLLTARPGPICSCVFVYLLTARVC